ncbi:MAG: IS1634 family transposase [Bacillota bacterium]
MPSIVRRTINNKRYYYAVESKRIDGKPTTVSQIYLGRAEDIVEKVTQPPRPQSVRTKEFGTIAALMGIAERLKFIQLIDSVVVKRCQGASPGQYLLLAAINRCSAPTSKSKIGEWYEGTVLPRLFKVDAKYFTSQRFWDNMDLITEAELETIQVELAKKVVKEYQIDLRVLLYDATNFFSFIDTNNQCTLPQRGHNKQKRHDLRQISLALLMSREDQVPLLYEPYQGNTGDSTEFDQFIRNLIGKCNDIFENVEEMTIVNDKGNNSKENLRLLTEDTPFHFIGSLVHTQNKELLAVPLSEYREFEHERLQGEKYYRTVKSIWGKKCTVVCVWNPELFNGQLQGIKSNLKKAVKELTELQNKLIEHRTTTKKGRKPTIDSTEKSVNQILSRQYIKELVSWQVEQVERGVNLEFEFNQEALEHLKDYLLGKTLIFTDHLEWDTEAIVLAYRDQYRIEHGFRQMKNPSWVSWYPLFHWTDQKIKVHSFYCFTALLFSSLLNLELKRGNLDFSIPKALEKLSKMQEVVIEYPKKRGQEPLAVCMLSEMDKAQKQLYKALGLNRYEV